MSKRRCNHGGGQLWRPSDGPPRPRFVISVRQVEKNGRANLDVRDAWCGEVLDIETAECVHKTRPQLSELDAKVVAGLLVEEQLRIADCGLRIEKKRTA